MDAKTFYIRHKDIEEQKKVQYNGNHISLGGKHCRKEVAEITLDMLMCVFPINSLLDIGCGALGLLTLLKGKVPHLYGIDIVDYAIWPKEPDIITRVVDVDKEGIVFPDATFDCVTMLSTLEHLFDPFTTIKEVYRVLKYKAYFILCVPNIAGIKHRINLLMGRLPTTSWAGAFNEKEWDGGHIHYFTLKSLVRLLHTEGPFKILDVKGSGRFQLLKSLRASFFSQDLILLCQKVLHHV
jgi:SAM-dependent methyltransferase